MPFGSKKTKSEIGSIAIFRQTIISLQENNQTEAENRKPPSCNYGLNSSTFKSQTEVYHSPPLEGCPKGGVVQLNSNHNK